MSETNYTSTATPSVEPENIAPEISVKIEEVSPEAPEFSVKIEEVSSEAPEISVKIEEVSPEAPEISVKIEKVTPEEIVGDVSEPNNVETTVSTDTASGELEKVVSLFKVNVEPDDMNEDANGTTANNPDVNSIEGGERLSTTEDDKAAPQSQSESGTEDNQNIEATNRSLWVKHLKINTPAMALKTMFSMYGKVESAKVVIGTTRPYKCYGYVTMATAQEANLVAEKHRNVFLDTGHFDIHEKALTDLLSVTRQRSVSSSKSNSRKRSHSSDKRSTKKLASQSRERSREPNYDVPGTEEVDRQEPSPIDETSQQQDLEDGEIIEEYNANEGEEKTRDRKEGGEKSKSERRSVKERLGKPLITQKSSSPDRGGRGRSTERWSAHPNAQMRRDFRAREPYHARRYKKNAHLYKRPEAESDRYRDRSRDQTSHSRARSRLEMENLQERQNLEMLFLQQERERLKLEWEQLTREKQKIKEREALREISQEHLKSIRIIVKRESMSPEMASENRERARSPLFSSRRRHDGGGGGSQKGNYSSQSENVKNRRTHLVSRSTYRSSSTNESQKNRENRDRLRLFGSNSSTRSRSASVTPSSPEKLTRTVILEGWDSQPRYVMAVEDPKEVVYTGNEHPLVLNNSDGVHQQAAGLPGQRWVLHQPGGYNLPHASHAGVQLPHASHAGVQLPHASHARVQLPHASHARVQFPHASHARAQLPHPATVVSDNTDHQWVLPASRTVVLPQPTGNMHQVQHSPETKKPVFTFIPRKKN